MNEEEQAIWDIMQGFDIPGQLKEALKPARATGRLEDSITDGIEQTRDGYIYYIQAFDYINNLAQGVGTPPSTGITLSQANEWRLAKGINISAYAIKTNIDRFGTRAFRGSNPFYDDPVGETLTPELFKEIMLALGKEFTNVIISRISDNG